MLFEEALGLTRLMIDRGIPQDEAIENAAIPKEYRPLIREALLREETVILEPARFIVAEQNRGEWLRLLDRSEWFYWPRLREYLIGVKCWGPTTVVRPLDETTDRILGYLAPPSTIQFDIRGLVLGYVQSGKTANFTALIAKAADAGYRLFIVLSGVDNGLRFQTQVRLDKELVGYADNRPGAVHLPPMGKQWHQFTIEHFEGDFQPGFANYAALQGTQPVLLVIKKNGDVLRRLLAWLDDAPQDIRDTLPLLVVDDEADQASIDTRGTYQTEDEPLPDDYEPPTTINGYIRELLEKFKRRVYIAYTATPFANMLIPHDTADPTVGNDLFPKDFIVDLPKPEGYFGAEELFGRFDEVAGHAVPELNVVRNTTDSEIEDLLSGTIPQSLSIALMDFVLGGAARAQRGKSDEPATMLIHVHQRTFVHAEMEKVVNNLFSEFKDEWRYQRKFGIRDRLMQRWEEEFRPVTRSIHLERDVPFEQVEPFINPFLESVIVKVINSVTGDMLDYESEPGLKAIAIGGNRLSRGLTLGGLLVSYFVRHTATYDALMQMGRWFGFRAGYDDLVRVYVTPDVARCFSDLALVEHQLRQDIQIYEVRKLTPMQVGTRIMAHSSMLVTSRLKQRYATRIITDQSYAGQAPSTFWFPFDRPDDLKNLLDNNISCTQELLNRLGIPSRWGSDGPVWQNVTSDTVVEFFKIYNSDPEATNISIPLICNYMQRQNEIGELQNWTVSIKGLQAPDPRLRVCDITVTGGTINPIYRSRIAINPNSLGIITNPGDEEEGLSVEQLADAKRIRDEQRKSRNEAARMCRAVTDGLLLIYPICRNSGYDLPSVAIPGKSRIRLYDNPDDSHSRGIIALAISFPDSNRAQRIVGEWIVGTAGWRPV
ncbi:MAG: Z1 domain-containing protein [Dehalococcoidia bacterium]|jgi:hypothetical protein